jgi:ribonuclease P protein component
MDNCNFPKEHRLLSSPDFNYLKKGAQSFRMPYMRAFYKPTMKDSTHSRVGLAISKKVGKAHRRNRLKRILREEYRASEFKEFGLDVLITISPFLDRKQSEASADLAIRENVQSLFLKLSKSK